MSKKKKKKDQATAFDIFAGVDLAVSGDQARKITEPSRKTGEYYRTQDRVRARLVEDGQLAGGLGYVGRYRNELLAAMQAARTIGASQLAPAADAAGLEEDAVAPLLDELALRLLRKHKATCEAIGRRRKVEESFNMPTIAKQIAAGSAKGASAELLLAMGEFEKIDAMEWGERNNIRLDNEVPYDPSLVPAMRAIAREIAFGESRFIIMPKAAQVGQSVLTQLEVMRRVASMEFGHILFIMESQDKAEQMMNRVIWPALQRLPNRPDIRTRKNEIIHATGRIVFAGAGGKRTAFASVSYKLCILDEASRFTTSKDEGSLFLLAQERIKQHRKDGKILVLSTPQNVSHADGSFYKLWDMSDRQEFHWVCLPEAGGCGNEFVPEFSSIVAQPDQERDALACPRCARLIQDGRERDAAIAAGSWKPTKQPRPGYRGYHITCFAQRTGFGQPLRRLREMEKDSREGGTPATFWQSTIGIFHQSEHSKKPGISEFAQKMQRDRPYRLGYVPSPASCLVAAVDVQKGWMTYEVYAASDRYNLWSVERAMKIMWDGKPLAIDDEARVHECLEALLAREFLREDGKAMRINLLAIDTGYRPDAVKAVLARFPSHRLPALDAPYYRMMPHGNVIPVKGNSADYNDRLVIHKPGSGRGQKGNSVVTHTTFCYGADYIKREATDAMGPDWKRGDPPIMMRLHCPTGDPHDPHNPYREETGYFAEHCAEDIEEKQLGNGEIVRVFARPRGRNESIDLMVMSRFAVELLNDGQISTFWRAEDWKRVRENNLLDPGGPDGQADDPQDFIRRSRIRPDEGREAELKADLDRLGGPTAAQLAEAGRVAQSLR